MRTARGMCGRARCDLPLHPCHSKGTEQGQTLSLRASAKRHPSSLFGRAAFPRLDTVADSPSLSRFSEGVPGHSGPDQGDPRPPWLDSPRTLCETTRRSRLVFFGSWFGRVLDLVFGPQSNVPVSREQQVTPNHQSHLSKTPRLGTPRYLLHLSRCWNITLELVKPQPVESF